MQVSGCSCSTVLKTLQLKVVVVVFRGLNSFVISRNVFAKFAYLISKNCVDAESAESKWLGSNDCDPWLHFAGNCLHTYTAGVRGFSAELDEQAMEDVATRFVDSIKVTSLAGWLSSRKTGGHPFAN